VLGFFFVQPYQSEHTPIDLVTCHVEGRGIESRASVRVANRDSIEPRASAKDTLCSRPMIPCAGVPRSVVSPATERWSSSFHRLMTACQRGARDGDVDTGRSSPSPSPSPPHNAVSRVAGSVTKRFAIESVFIDLFLAALSSAEDPLFAPRRVRRVVRMGGDSGVCGMVGGVVTYEIPFGRGDPAEGLGWSLETVFGATAEEVLSSSRKKGGGVGRGMKMDDVLDGVDARISYVPTYSCTSFVVSHRQRFPSVR
jgi:hypothetical protein